MCVPLPDKPGPCENFKVTGVTENSVALKWDDPKDDGGCLITQYVVEHREAVKRSWTRDGTSTENEYTAIALTEGTNYIFQVAAENECGVGEFVELSKAIVPKSQFGEFIIILGYTGFVLVTVGISHIFSIVFQVVTPHL